MFSFVWRVTSPIRQRFTLYFQDKYYEKCDSWHCTLVSWHCTLVFPVSKDLSLSTRHDDMMSGFFFSKNSADKLSKDTEMSYYRDWIVRNYHDIISYRWDKTGIPIRSSIQTCESIKNLSTSHVKLWAKYLNAFLKVIGVSIIELSGCKSILFLYTYDPQSVNHYHYSI